MTAPAPTPPRVGGWRAMLSAFWAPFRGALTLLVRPALWPLAVTPTLAFGLLAALGGLGARALFHRVHAHLRESLGSQTAVVLGDALVIVALVLVVGIAALLLVPPLAAPFMDSLAARVDRRQVPDEPLWNGIVRSVRVALAGLFLVGVPQLAVWALSLVLPWLSPLWLLLGGSLAAMGLAYDALDWPLARRALGVRARLRWMREHRAQTLGLGLAAWLVSLVPGLSLVMLPALVVGGVAVVNAVEDAEETPWELPEKTHLAPTPPTEIT